MPSPQWPILLYKVRRPASLGDTIMGMMPNKAPRVCITLEALPFWSQLPALTIDEGTGPSMPSSAVIKALQIKRRGMT